MQLRSIPGHHRSRGGVCAVADPAPLPPLRSSRPGTASTMITKASTRTQAHRRPVEYGRSEYGGLTVKPVVRFHELNHAVWMRRRRCPVCDGEICSCAVGFGVDSARLAWFLAECGIQLSRPQVYRAVHQRPERVSLQLMAALCDIFGSGVDDLVTVMPNWSADESCSGLGSFDPSGPGSLAFPVVGGSPTCVLS